MDQLCALCCVIQAEVDDNRVAALLNIAAVAVEKAEYRTAAQLCSRALALESGSRKALLRRAKAHMGRHEPQVPQKLMLCRNYANRLVSLWINMLTKCSDFHGI